MILKNMHYDELAEYIKRYNKKVVIYGAGMVGKIVMPYLISFFHLHEYIDCYVDMDAQKLGSRVAIDDKEYEVRHPEYLKNGGMEQAVILITNTKFYTVVDYLDRIPGLAEAEGCIIPVMQIQEVERSGPVLLEQLCCEQLIPKTIHYCWFGNGTIPNFLKMCISTWREFCPDYEIIQWDESNYDVSKYAFCREAYEQKRYSFAADVARLDILYQHGGIYLDTDVSLMRNLDLLLYQPGFVGVEKWGNINTGGMAGAKPGHPMIKEMLDYRNQFHFVDECGRVNIETNGVYETVPFLKRGMRIDNSLQIINGMTVYPSSVFHPYDYMSGKDQIVDCTVAKHYFYGSWMDEPDIWNRSNTQMRYGQVLGRMGETGHGGRDEMMRNRFPINYCGVED